MARTDANPDDKIKPDEAQTVRYLSEDELRVLGNIRDTEAQLSHLLSQIENLGANHGDREAMRWLGMARNNLETGMMFAMKSVVRPDDGLGRRTPK